MSRIVAGLVVLFALAVSAHAQDRKSTRLNSSHMSISYAVFCLKKKKKKKKKQKTIQKYAKKKNTLLDTKIITSSYRKHKPKNRLTSTYDDTHVTQSMSDRVVRS